MQIRKYKFKNKFDHLAGELALHQHDDEHARGDGRPDQQPGEPRQRRRHRNLLSLESGIFFEKSEVEMFDQQNLDLRAESQHQEKRRNPDQC